MNNYTEIEFAGHKKEDYVLLCDLDVLTVFYDDGYYYIKTSSCKDDVTNAIRLTGDKSGNQCTIYSLHPVLPVKSKITILTKGE